MSSATSRMGVFIMTRASVFCTYDVISHLAREKMVIELKLGQTVVSHLNSAPLLCLLTDIIDWPSSRNRESSTLINTGRTLPISIWLSTSVLLPGPTFIIGFNTGVVFISNNTWCGAQGSHLLETLSLSIYRICLQTSVNDQNNPESRDDINIISSSRVILYFFHLAKSLYNWQFKMAPLYW